MNFTVILDWKGILALGGCFFIIWAAVHMDGEELENVSIHLIDAAFPNRPVADSSAIGAF